MIISAIIFLNVIVFVLWNFGGEELFYFMYENFLVSWDSLATGRWWTLITSVFSHNAVFHILINMLVLRNFGDLIVRFMGGRQFIRFYLVSGIVASFSHAAVSAWLLNQPDLPALGASGAVAATVVMFSFMFPREKILLLGFVPIPALWGAIAFIAIDLFGLFAQFRGGGLPIGHGAHLGGALTAIIWYFASQRRRRMPFY